MSARRRLPPWLKVRFPAGERYQRIKGLLRTHRLHSVCEEARCPNIGECFNAGTATFMILGDICTRSCAFCAVTSGRPTGVDYLEPYRLARSVELLGLDYVVITSVTRDDLPDGGAGIFAACVEAIQRNNPRCRVEVLVPDFVGDWNGLATVVEARPFVLGHNVETVPRLYRRVRPKAGYRRSLDLLAKVKELEPSMLTKSGIMVGLGETREEILEVMAEDASVAPSIADIFRYLTAPEPDGCGLVPGDTGPMHSWEVNNWLRHAFGGLWHQRKCRA